MNDEFRGHSPLPNVHEVEWMSIEPFAAIRRIAVLVLLAFAVAMALAPAPMQERVIPAEAGTQPEARTREYPPANMEATGGVLAYGMRFSAPRPLV